MKFLRYVLFFMVCYGHLSLAMDALKKKQKQVAQIKNYQFGPTTITIAIGDITKVRVDAIVNAANAQLSWGGGVCGAIFKAAGKNNLVNEVTKVLNGASSIPIGEARITPVPDTDENGNDTIKKTYGVKYVVHAVGPDCREEDQEANRRFLLRSAYKNSLFEADKVGVKSIAFPAISTAIFKCPLEEATGFALDAIMQTVKETKINHVFCIFLSKGGGYDLYEEKLEALASWQEQKLLK